MAKYFCIKMEQFNCRKKPGMAKVCSGCENRFFCVSTDVIKQFKFRGFMMDDNRVILVATQSSKIPQHTSHLSSSGGINYTPLVKKIGKKFKIDFSV